MIWLLEGNNGYYINGIIKPVVLAIDCPWAGKRREMVRKMTKVIEESLWIQCPVCHKRTRTKVYPDTIMTRFPLYCRNCKKEYRIDVIKLRMTLSDWARRKLAQSLLPYTTGDAGSFLSWVSMYAHSFFRRLERTAAHTSNNISASLSEQSANVVWSFTWLGVPLLISG